jgi:hypothetical protein
LEILILSNIFEKDQEARERTGKEGQRRIKYMFY